MPRPTYATLTATAIPASNGGSGYYTTTQTGSAITLGVAHDVFGPDAHTGYMDKGLLIIEQTAAGSGNNSGNKFTFTVQTARSSSGPWLTVPLTSTVEITANAAAQFGSTFPGPLSGYLRVVATATGTPQAQFTAYVVCGG